MSDLKLNSTDVQRVRKAVDAAIDEMVENNQHPDDTLTGLAEFCALLLDGGTVDSFLSSMDIEEPSN